MHDVAVVGGGTLGRRIALMFADRGGTVRVFDADPARAAEAAAWAQGRLSRLVAGIDGGSEGAIVAAADVAEAVAGAWLVVEAVPERLELKQRVLADLDRLAPPDAIIATNSSSYPASRLIGDVARPERVVNLHFYMPPHAVAVEVMSCGQTDPTILDMLMARLPTFGLVPFLVHAESVGFIFNRIWAAVKREAMTVVAEGVATPEEVDRLFTMNLGAPSGPFRMMDAIGLDVVLDVEEHYAREAGGALSEAPRRLLREALAEGRLGRKSGRGFYDDYDAG
ncbi:MAG TPA: 3-hydroxyacyl-CoA dehydrogenase family protein [Baekduia sp.]|jgi:3-hydroxybutyryl-CoA dehydrogenase